MLSGLEFRHAIYRLARHSSVTGSIVLILACGIGATTTIFSVVDAVILRPLPWSDPQRLVVIHGVSPHRRNHPAFAATWNRAPVSWASWQTLRQAPPFQDVSAWFAAKQILLASQPEEVSVIYASSSLLKVLGTSTVLGRFFAAEEDLVESDLVIISHATWRRRFGARSDIVGRIVTLASDANSRSVPKVIIGVLPPSFALRGEAPEFVLPIGLMAFNGSFETNRFLRVIARLAPGFRSDDALRAAETAVRGSESEDTRSATILTALEDELDGAGNPLIVILAGSALLLLLSCANVGGLLLADLKRRRAEIALRLALGSRRVRILQQLFVEHLVIAALSASLGVVLCFWLIPVVSAQAPVGLRGLDSVQINMRAMGFAAGLSFMVALLLGVAPVLAVSSLSPASTLRQNEMQQTRSDSRVQRAILSIQLALSFVLVVCAGLFGETLYRLTSRPLGFDDSRLIVATIVPSRLPPMAPVDVSDVSADSHDPDRTKIRADFENRLAAGVVYIAGLLDGLQQLPEIETVAGASAAPFASRPATIRVRAHGEPELEHYAAYRLIVTPEFFGAAGIRVTAGRNFEAADRNHGLLTVVSQEMARGLFAGDAVGRRLVQGRLTYRIIGVAEDVTQRSQRQATVPTFYVLDRQAGVVNDLLIRLRRSVTPAILETVRRRIKDHDPHIQIKSIQLMSDIVADSIAAERFRATLSSSFAFGSIILSIIGCYGLTAAHMIERRREIAVRVALGATLTGIRRLLLREFANTVCVGVVLGVAAGILASFILRALFVGAGITAPFIFLLCATLLVSAAALAVVLPTMRVSVASLAADLRD